MTQLSLTRWRCQRKDLRRRLGLCTRAVQNIELLLTVDTTVEPSPLVVVILTIPAPLASVAVLLPPELPAPVVELPVPVELPEPEPAPVGIAVAAVVYVDPLLSVVVIRIPPGTSPPMVEVILLPEVSVPVATTTVLVPVATVVEKDFVVAPDSEPELLEPVAAETAEEITEDAAA